MNKQERIEMVRAMETIARCINDEDVFESWLMYGVADGDVDETTSDDELSYYIEDENYSELMQTFLNVMSRAKRSGGLYSDNITSKN